MEMQSVVKQIARGVVIALAIPGAILIALLVVTVVPSLYHA
jgi:hypothetical protein